MGDEGREPSIVIYGVYCKLLNVMIVVFNGCRKRVNNFHAQIFVRLKYLQDVTLIQSSKVTWRCGCR